MPHTGAPAARLRRPSGSKPSAQIHGTSAQVNIGAGGAVTDSFGAYEAKVYVVEGQ